MKKTIYDVVKNILINYPETRNSFKKTLWRYWEEMGLIDNGLLSMDIKDLMKISSPETISRARRAVIDNDYKESIKNDKLPLLQPSSDVRREIKRKTDQKGTFIYREK